MSANRGKPAIASWAPDRIDVFVRTADARLVHNWVHGDRSGAVNLGGEIASDPVAVAYGVDLLSVFARSRGLSLLHWVWDAKQSRMVGPEDWGRPDTTGALVPDPGSVGPGWEPGAVGDSERSGCVSQPRSVCGAESRLSGEQP